MTQPDKLMSGLVRQGNGKLVEVPLSPWRQPCASCGALITHNESCRHAKNFCTIIKMNERRGDDQTR